MLVGLLGDTRELGGHEKSWSGLGNDRLDKGLNKEKYGFKKAGDHFQNIKQRSQMTYNNHLAIEMFEVEAPCAMLFLREAEHSFFFSDCLIHFVCLLGDVLK